MKRDTFCTIHGWMTGVVVISACLQLAAGWSVLRNREAREASDGNILEDSERLLWSQEHEQNLRRTDEYTDNTDNEEEDLVLDIEGEGPLSDVQMQILQVLLTRYVSEDRETLAEMAVDDLVS